jgi:membrane-associated protease RseP (regulator of RpoE activity)
MLKPFKQISSPICSKFFLLACSLTLLTFPIVKVECVDCTQHDEPPNLTVSGIGIALRQWPDKTIGVGGLIPESPALKAGIREKDQLVSINGRPVEGLSIQELSAKIRGTPGTKVTIVFQRNGVSKTYELIREVLQKPPAGGSCARKTKVRPSRKRLD